MKIGRTHLQDATPVRLGQEFSGYAAQVEHGIARASRAIEVLSELPLGGTAVGTGLNAHPDFAKQTVARLADGLGIAVERGAEPFRGGGDTRCVRRGQRLH